MKSLILVVCFSFTLFSMPAKRTPTVVMQPDGTPFSVVGFGDEYYHFTETLDGYVVVQADDNFWYYADLDATGRYVPGPVRVTRTASGPQGAASVNLPRHLRESDQVIAEKTRSYTIEQKEARAGALNKRVPKMNKVGSAVNHVLILCVQFPDLASTYTSQSFQDMVNNDGWKDGTGGMSRYYKEVSYDALSIDAHHADWITANHNRSYYAYNNAAFGAHVRELVEQCCDEAYMNGFDFEQYDNDGDGNVDGLFIVHAGKGAEEGGDENYIWSHSGDIGPLEYGYVSVDHYIILPEINFSHHAEIGVFCHEYGHVLGLPDLYDTDGATHGKSEGLGNWCLMSSGSWGGDGDTPDRPVHMSAYCKELLGYAAPSVLAAGGALTIAQTETGPSMVKVWLDNDQSDEYLLIENRQKTGFDVNLPEPGLLMYHIDKNLADMWPAANKINVTKAHTGVKLYEADGLEELANAANRGNAGDPYPGSSGNTGLAPTSSPNTSLWNGMQSDVGITHISAASAAMTATAALPVYYGYCQQFYREFSGYGFGNQTTSFGYGMLECIPSRTGKLAGLRICSSANRYSSIEARVFATFTGTELSNQIGTAVTGASASIDQCVQLSFSPAIPVTQNVPVYIRLYFQRPSGGYAVPIDISAPATGHSYYSRDGVTFSRFLTYDVAARVVFESTTPMPVELTTFTAAARQGSVMLTWETATEHDNYGFDVERKISAAPGSAIRLGGEPAGHDGWTKIGFVEGGGTSNVSKTYSFTDTPGPGTFSYRLKQIDRGGQVSYSSVIEAASQRSPSVFGLAQNYPNPFNPGTTISFVLSSTEHATLSVYNMLGQHAATLFDGMAEGNAVHTVRFEGAGYASGIYFYRLTTATHTEQKRMQLLK